jgi:Protein of unknown function (DUF2939)
MLMKRSKVVLALGVCVAAGWLYVAPLLACRKLAAAAERGDMAALNEVVDFPALRGSFSENIKTSVARGIDRDGGNPVAALGGMMAGSVAAPVVNAAVTPAGLALLARGRDPRRGEPKDADRESRLKREWGYESMNRFALRFVDRESRDERIALILRRDGLGWKLSGVRFGPRGE